MNEEDEFENGNSACLCLQSADSYKLTIPDRLRRGGG